ncbi:ectonucleoside triphosphate diphosphohydrolase 7-like [Halichondria panicea]|uniref:ectonucleoside triphosphate diphosphohydrolase 7-like n=1 Tax=Halichondria panicea TaxID=6063 RepID=UPI00312B93A8
MPPTSPGRLLSTRLFICLSLGMLLCLALISLRNYVPIHYRYVSKTTLGTASGDLTSHNFAIVIDAGSSSSKVHLFHWPPHDGNPHKLLEIYPLTDVQGDPLVKKVEPGISTFASTPAAAFNSLVPLLAYASHHIPSVKHPHTVLYVLGTAGMRLLSLGHQERIMDYIAAAVSREYPFHLSKDGIQVISGKLEGVFSWITINYLLGNFSPESHAHAHTAGSEHIHTVGVMDMGGASLQIAFEVPQQIEVHNDKIVEINLGCGLLDNEHKHRVYSMTYLGYGSNTVRTKYYTSLAKHFNTSNHTALRGPILKDPCSQQGLTENVTLSANRWVRVRGSGNFPSCRTALLTGTAVSNGSCGPKACLEGEKSAFEKPPGYLGYASMNFYGTSEFWYTMRDVLGIGGAYSAREFERKSTEFCSTEWRLVRDRFARDLYTYANLYRLRSQCLKSAWLSVVLHEGLEFPRESLSLRTLSTLRGQSVAWPLGALLYLTRYLPLREVQLQQQQHRSTVASQWELHSITHSTLTLPLLAVLCVILILLACRHRRGQHSPLLFPGSNISLPRSFSQASGLKVHRRAGSVSNPSLPRIQSSGNIDWIV